jgi:hypothetical protein
MNRLSIVAALGPPILALGCAAGVSREPLPPDHPANPAAAEAPAPQHSQTLVAGAAPQGQPQTQPAPSPEHGGDHAHH